MKWINISSRYTVVQLNDKCKWIVLKKNEDQTFSGALVDSENEILSEEDIRRATGTISLLFRSYANKKEAKLRCIRKFARLSVRNKLNQL